MCPCDGYEPCKSCDEEWDNETLRYKKRNDKFREKLMKKMSGENVDYSYWVKNLDGNVGMKINDYDYFDNFIKVGDFKLKKDKLDLEVSKEMETLYSKRQNLIYIITRKDEILKIGGTKVGMKNRMSSYKCGYYIKERRNNKGENYPGKMSATNAYVYHSIYHYTKYEKDTFSLHIYPIEDIYVEIEIFGKKKKIKTQIYDEWEKQALDIYIEKFRKMPVLCNNSHP